MHHSLIKKKRSKAIFKVSALGLIIAATLNNTIHAAEISAESKINAVTVYPGSAKVSRTATIKLDQGSNEVVISNLPINLNESSLRVSGEGQGKISLGSIELLRDIKLDVVQQQEKELRHKIEEVQDSRKVINDALTRNRTQLEYIKNMALGANTKPAPLNENHQHGSYANLPLEQWQQAWQTLDSATADVQDKIRIAEKSLKNNDKELKKLKRELQMIATNQKETRSAKLHVDSEVATELTLNLSYQINGARWEPVYDADLNTETGDISLKTLAQISQRTGEDWKGIDITLSTLRPSANSQLPELRPWPIDFMPEARPMAEASFNKGIAMDRMESMVASPAPVSKMAKPKRRMQQAQTRLISADFSAEYKVPGTISLGSGSNERRFALSSQSLKSSIHLASAPRQDARAMILAKTQYVDETPLLAGSMSLYRNGSFVGNTFLSQKLSGEEIKLSFGEDNKVKVTFLPDPDKKRKDGLLFGKKKVVERHYKVNISSNHDKPSSITLYDVFPIASDEQIKVKLFGDAPSKTDLDDKKGVSSWDRTLAPKSKSSLKYGYSVSYPEDRMIPGL